MAVGVVWTGDPGIRGGDSEAVDALSAFRADLAGPGGRPMLEPGFRGDVNFCLVLGLLCGPIRPEMLGMTALV